jgi:N-acetylglucosamine-6-phosphate deacetylase
MDAAVRNVVEHAGVPLADALTAASTAPASLLGLDDRGRIAPGARADLVALSPAPALAVEQVWIAGTPVL